MASSDALQVMHARCGGLDLRQHRLHACVLLTLPNGQPQCEQRTFGTTGEEVERLLAWLLDAGCTHVALERTKSVWQQIAISLETHLTVVLLDAQHSAHMPGRKAALSKAAWIAGLLRHGLVPPEPRPDVEQRELQELMRYRSSMVSRRLAAHTKLCMILEGNEDALVGAMPPIQETAAHELVAIASDPVLLARCATDALKEKLPDLERALAGYLGEDRRLLVARLLAYLDHITTTIAELDSDII